MNPVLAEIYSTIIPSAPYVLGAYVLVFIVLFVYVFFTVSKLKSAEKKMDALEERVEEGWKGREREKKDRLGFGNQEV